MYNKHLRSHVFQKTFYTYFAVFFLLIFCFAVVYYRSYDKQETQRIEQGYKNDALRISSSLDSHIGELINLKNSIQHTTWVKKIITPTNTFDSDFDVISRIEYQDELLRYMAFNPIVSDIAIILPQKDLVVSPYGWYNFSEYKTYLHKNKETDFDEICELIKQHTDINSLTEIKSNAIYEKPLICMQSLDNQQKPAATLLILVNRQQFEKQIATLSGSETQGVKLLSNNKMNLISYIKQVNRHSYSVKLDSKFIAAEYEFCSDIPNSKLLTTPAAIPLILITIGLLFVVIVLSYFLSLLSYKPLERLTAYIAQINGIKTQESKQEYEFIEQSFDAMYGKNVSMNAKVELYYSAARNNMLMNLLKGYFNDSDIGKLTGEYNLDYTNEKSYMVMIINKSLQETVEDISVKNRNGAELITMIGQFLARNKLNFEIIEAMDSDTVVILSFQNNQVQKLDLLDIAYQLKSVIFENIHTMLNISLGQAYGGILGISKSYHELKDSINTDYNNYSFDVFQSKKENVNYYYPTDWEIQLISSMKVGNISTAKKIFEEIISENTARKLSSTVTMRLISLLLETIKRIAYELNLNVGQFDESVQKLQYHIQDTELAWKSFRELMLRLCDDAAQMLAAQSTSEGGEIIQYVNNNYAEVTMSLKELSEQFKLPSYAISKIFKENSGVNFYEYITELRMKQAKKLFESIGYDIAKVSASVGYENEYSFRRAFLKYTGMKPKEYAQKINTDISKENN